MNYMHVPTLVQNAEVKQQFKELQLLYKDDTASGKSELQSLRAQLAAAQV